MEYKYNSDTLMHGVGFNFSKFESVLSHGILSLECGKAENVRINRSFKGRNKDDEISMVRYLYIDAYDDFDIKLSDKEGAYYRYILNGISFIVEDVQFETQNAHRVDEVLVKNKDALLEDLFYFPMSKYYENIKNISEDYIRYMASYGYEVNINEYKNLINELRYTYNALIDASKEDIEDLEDDYEDVLADLNEYMAQNISACFRKKLGYDITLYDLVIFLRNKNKVNLPIYIIPYTREKGKAK